MIWCLWQLFRKNCTRHRLSDTHHSPEQLLLLPSMPPSEEKLTKIPPLPTYFFEPICSCFQLTSYPNKRLSPKPMPKTARRPRPSQACQSQPEAASEASTSAPLWSPPQEPSPVGHTEQGQRLHQGRCSLTDVAPEHPPGPKAKRILQDEGSFLGLVL